MNEMTKTEQKSLVSTFAAKLGVDGNKMLSTLKATAFKQRDGSEVSNEQMMALLVVANQYGLNPFTKEIYAFPDRQNGVIPVVGVDGWSRIINQNSQFDGIEFRQAENVVEVVGAKPCPEWIECIIYRKDRAHPTVVREYLDEVYRAPFKSGMSGPWQSHTKRFLRHKAMIQCARIAFGYVGIFDEDEGERIIGSNVDAGYEIIEDAKEARESISNISASIKAKADNKESEEPEQPMFTYAEIADKINKAKSSDDVDEAVSLSSGLPKDQVDELAVIAESRKGELG